MTWQGWQRVENLHKLSRAQLLARLRGNGGQGHHQVQGEQHQGWRQLGRNDKVAWYCVECGAEHTNARLAKCRVCKAARPGYIPPPSKPRPIDSPEVKSVFQQLRLIEQDEKELAEMRDDLSPTPSPSPTLAEEKASLDRMLTEMVSNKVADICIAGVRKRLEDISQQMAVSQDLGTSITLRQALKRTRDLHSKMSINDNRDVEAAKAALAEAQTKLDTAIAKQAEHVAKFHAEEAKLVDALTKAEEKPKEQEVVVDADVFNRLQAMHATPEGRAAMAARGIKVDEDISPTQPGSQEASEREVEALVGRLPARLHAALAKRLAQPGVQSTLQPEGLRSRNQHRESSAERQSRLGSRSRTP